MERASSALQLMGGLNYLTSFGPFFWVKQMERQIMIDSIKDSVKKSAAADQVVAMTELVSTYGAADVLMEADPDELTALHLAAGSGALGVVEYLLSDPIGADSRAARINNFTPLHAAAMNGHATVCQALLRAGACANVQTKPQGYTPLHSAAFAGHVEAIQVLLSHGAKREFCNYRDEKPVDTALRQGKVEAALLLDPDRHSVAAE